MNNKAFKDWASMSNKALTEYIGRFVSHHRLEQNKTQDELSAAAGISRSTLSSLVIAYSVLTIESLNKYLRIPITYKLISKN